MIGSIYLEIKQCCFFCGTRGALLCSILLPAFFLLGTGTSLAAPSSGNYRLIIAGSGTNLSITRLLAKAFMRTHPGVGIEIRESIGSSAAIQAVSDGAIPVGLISRPLKEKENSLGLTVLQYARTALVIGVHKSVPDDGITYEDFLNIYRGKMNRWKNGKEIIVLTREPGESVIEMLKNEIPGFAEVYESSQKRELWVTLSKVQVMNETLAKTPFAIGLSDLGTMTIERLAIKPLKINGVAPSIQNIQSGKYRLVRNLYLVYRKERLPAPAKLFVEFLQSKTAGKIMKANGFAPGK